MKKIILDDLRADLMSLRKGKGFTRDRVATTMLPDLMHRHESEFLEIKRHFFAKIKAIGASDQSFYETLGAAYGLLDGYEEITTLNGRRMKFSREIAHVGDDTLKSREDAMIADLANILFKDYLSDEELTAHIFIPSAQVLFEYQNLTAYVGRDGQDERVIYDKKLIPLVNFPTFPKPSEAYGCQVWTDLAPLQGISNIESQYFESGCEHEIFFDQTLRPNRGHVYTFEEQPKKDKKIKQTYESIHEISAPNYEQRTSFAYEGLTFYMPTYHSTMTVHFDQNIPSKIWWYENKLDATLQTVPDIKNLLYVSSDGFVSHKFTNLFGGLDAGIAWVW